MIEKTSSESQLHDISLIREAYEEAMRRYPESQPGLVFFSYAIGLHTGEVTQDVLEWAEKIIAEKKKSN